MGGSSATSRTAWLVVGPAEHGVVRHGRAIHRGLMAGGHDARLLHAPDVASAYDVVGRCSADVDVVHLQVTDRLFGRPAGAAAEAVLGLVGLAATTGTPFTVTLHDLPQPSDGSWADERREAYRQIACAAAGVIVSSHFEHDLLVAAGGPRSEVVPQPVESLAAGPPPRTERLSVGVLGFLYPGKGHAETLTAMDGIPAAVEFWALGRASDGHADLVDDLARRCDAQGRTLRVTGYLPDEALAAEARAVTVPVAHPTHVSASASLSTWVALGRRPRTAASAYSREIDAAWPGILALHDPTPIALAEAIRHALDDPRDTWLGDGTPVGPDLATVAALHADLLDRWAR